MGSYPKAAALADHVALIGSTSRAAWAGGVARTTRSKAAPSTRQPAPSRASSRTRVAVCTTAPCRCSQDVAGTGNRSPRLTRGSSRSAEPGPLKSASRSTRNTAALASLAGVFNAATHSGSIRSRAIVSPRPRLKDSTVAAGSQRKPRAAHPWPQPAGKGAHATTSRHGARPRGQMRSPAGREAGAGRGRRARSGAVGCAARRLRCRPPTSRIRRRVCV